jgi:hypothetical protein
MAVAPLYPPGDTHVLSDTARELHEHELDAHAVVAETLLGLRSTKYSGDEADQAALAVAHQVNFQVFRPALFALVQSETKGTQSVTFRETQGEKHLTDDIAAAIVDRLASTVGWPTIRSKRS